MQGMSIAHAVLQQQLVRFLSEQMACSDAGVLHSSFVGRPLALVNFHLMEFILIDDRDEGIST